MGGSGRDRVVYETAADSRPGNQRDVIIGFDGEAPFSAAGEARVTDLGDDTLVQCHLDGDPGAEGEVLLQDGRTTAADRGARDFLLRG